MMHFKYMHIVALVLGAVVFAFSASSGLAQGSQSKEELLSRSEKLLDAVENGVLTELKEEEDELRADATNSTYDLGDPILEAQVKAQDEEMRAKARELAQKIDRWATSGEDYLNQVDSQELNMVMAEARTIAKYFGLDVKKLGDLYELGKDTIKSHEFVLPNKLPPDKDYSYEAYFESFFIFAHERELELSEYREKQQEYRLTLFKRVTLAYIRALLASTEPIPPCNATEATQTITLSGQSFKSFGCKDPVVEELRAYVQAVQKIAEADADRFSAEAEVVLAQQELVTDLSAGLPLVGDAMDYYNLYAGQDLAGRCLTRLDYGLTSVFAAIPFMPSGWATQAVKRMGMEKHVSSLFMLMADSATWSQDMITGVAKSFGITAEHFAAVQSKIDIAKQIAMIEISVTGAAKSKDWIPAASKKFGISEETLESAWDKINTDITFPGGIVDGIDVPENVVSSTAARQMADEMDADAVFVRNLEIAADADQLVKNMPPKILDIMRKRSQAFLEHNVLDIPMNRAALRGDNDEVIEASNMLPEHVKAFMEVAETEDRAFFVRYVNPTATGKYADGSAMTKGMNVKGKSAMDSVQASFIPVDQKFSKLTDAAEIAKYSGKVKECLDSGVCKEMHLVLENGDVGFIWKSATGEKTIVKRGDKYVDFDTGKVLDVNPDDVRPLMVLAEYNPKTGKLMPLTADYDLLAVGSKDGIAVPKMDKVEGMRNAVESDSIGKLNAAAEESTGHEGIDMFHHGGENQNPMTPGSYDKDPYVTLIDPKYKALNIPVCDYDCMVKWCKSPHSPCGAMPVCAANDPKGPCIQIDAERLLKDMMHHRIINGYSDLRPNSKWDWGPQNGISGWSPKILLEDGSTAQYAVKVGLEKTSAPSSGWFGKIANRSAKDNALKAVEYLFTCPSDSAGGAP